MAWSSRRTRDSSTREGKSPTRAVDFGLTGYGDESCPFSSKMSPIVNEPSPPRSAPRHAAHRRTVPSASATTAPPSDCVDAGRHAARTDFPDIWADSDENGQERTTSVGRFGRRSMGRTSLGVVEFRRWYAPNWQAGECRRRSPTPTWRCAGCRSSFSDICRRHLSSLIDTASLTRAVPGPASVARAIIIMTG